MIANRDGHTPWYLNWKHISAVVVLSAIVFIETMFRSWVYSEVRKRPTQEAVDMSIMTNAPYLLDKERLHGRLNTLEHKLLKVIENNTAALEKLTK